MEEIRCKICGKEFKNLYSLARHIKKHEINSKDYYDKYLKKDNEGICPVCHKQTPFLKFSKGYQKHCSSKCAQNNPETNNTFRNNNPQKNSAIRQKTEKTCLKKYGSKSSLGNKEVREKGEKTLMSTYGVKNIFQLPEIKHKARINSHSKRANNKRKRSMYIKLRKIEEENNCVFIQDLLSKTKSSGWYQSGVVTPLKIDGYLFIRNEDIHKVFDYDNNAYHVYSIKEKKIVNAIKQIYKGSIIENSKSIITPKELDIYIPELNLAVEFNGDYFHSTLNGTPKEYHVEKSIMCKNKNIRLIHIYEFEDLEEQISLLLNLIEGVDKYNKKDFNKNNLIQDEMPNPKLIFDDGRLQVYGVGKLY